MAPTPQSRSSQELINVKLLLIGNLSVGKSSLLLRFSDKQWLPEDEASTTIGVDFRVRSRSLASSKPPTLSFQYLLMREYYLNFRCTSTLPPLPPTLVSTANVDRVEDRSDSSSTVSGTYFSSLRSSYNKQRVTNTEPVASAPSLPSLKSSGLLESWAPQPQPPSQLLPEAGVSLKDELEKATADLRDRVVLGVQIPTAAHSALIGRGGRNLINFQNKFNVQVQYPGSNSYKNTGEPENAEELSDVPPEQLVKVAGARASVGEAVEQLKVCCLLAR
jgi:KH domain/Ras family